MGVASCNDVVANGAEQEGDSVAWNCRMAQPMIHQVKALTFDTGGTTLQWHAGISKVLERVGSRHSISADWGHIATSYRRQSLDVMLGAIGQRFNIDDVHRRVLDLVLADYGLDAFDSSDREEIWRAWHELEAWPDFPPALARFRKRFVVVSFTILSTSMAIDVSRRNKMDWDCLIACEMTGIYKPHPEAYRITAKLLGLQPSQIMMVSAHNFDLLAAREQGYHSAFVSRPDEWGPLGGPAEVPDPVHDVVASDFAELADALGA
jgi:2-haloacid dehalogenase